MLAIILPVSVYIEKDYFSSSLTLRFLELDRAYNRLQGKKFLLGACDRHFLGIETLACAKGLLYY